MAEHELTPPPIKVVVFIPAFNEAESITDVIVAVNVAFRGSEARGLTLETILVDDGSTDETISLAEAAGISRVVRHPKNLGLGAATRTGMRVAYSMGADIAVKLDADLQHDPNDIEKCLQPILNDEADIVWGSRFAGEIRYRMPLHRRWGNRVFTWLMNVLTDYDISDAQTGLMLFNRRYLSRFQILADYNPPQQLLLDANSKHMRYSEVPVVFNPRTKGASFVKFNYPIKVVLSILWIVIYANPLRVFVPLGLLLFSISIGVAVFNVIQYFGESSDRLFANWGTILLFSIAGMQTLFFGILADMIVRKNPTDL